MNRFESGQMDNTVSPEEIEQIISIEDPEEARDFIHQRLENGERPVVTVPKEYTEALKSGLKAHSSWLPGTELITATISRSPYLPKNQERVIVRVEKISQEQIEPKFTGPDKKFHGVVVLNGPISPEAIIITKST